ncbi:MAG TPA: Arm DNA-binding domain-containing protein, partial [Methylocella sp.]|nr:Arm DNA-binding domain-containing protein [Methylocella sp.]
MPKLTKRFVDTLQPDPAKDLFFWDSELAGFGIRVKPSGSASYLIQYRTPERQTRRFAFAKVRAITPDQARHEGRRLLDEARSGGDPSRSRHGGLTVAGLCAAYLKA